MKFQEIHGYVMRQGRRIETVTLEPVDLAPPRKPFVTQWVKLPIRWVETLVQAKSAAATYQLALIILAAAYEDKRRTGVVTLSTERTKMAPQTRRRAARELAELGLIALKADGRKAFKVKPIVS